MSKTTSFGDNAFFIPGCEQHEEGNGMSLRDYFAAQAMQGMLAYPGCETRGSHHNNNSPEGVAEMAYRYAVAMLKARES